MMSKSAIAKLVKRNNVKPEEKQLEFPALYKYSSDGSVYLFTKPQKAICLIETDDFAKFGDCTTSVLDCTDTKQWQRLPPSYAVKIFNR